MIAAPMHDTITDENKTSPRFDDDGWGRLSAGGGGGGGAGYSGGGGRGDGKSIAEGCCENANGAAGIASAIKNKWDNLSFIFEIQ